MAARAAAYSQAAPVNVLLSPLESIFQKSRFLLTPPSPSSLPMSRSSPPRPGSWRSLPPRRAAAEESCPRRSGSGERVLSAPCVRREWSCCKMAAEAHAAGSKPDPVPLASERAPDARARARVTPPSLPTPPSRVRFSLLSPCPPSAPPFPPTTATSLRPPSVGLSSSPPCPFPPPSSLLSAAAQARVATFPLAFERSFVRSLPHSLARSLSSVPQSLPSRLLSFSLPR